MSYILKRIIYYLALLASICLIHRINLYPQKIDPVQLKQEFDFSSDRSDISNFYKMETKVLTYSPDGKRIGTDIYTLFLKCKPIVISNERCEEYYCKKFIVQSKTTPPVQIPSLEGWTYVFKATNSGIDEKGQVFGIDHSKFEKLSDSNKKPLPPGVNYFIYNTFIDFHSFCDVFAQKTQEGKGIQDLKFIGQKIIHDAAFSEAPVNLGSNVKKGSSFKNGEITLEFKGLSIINDRECAIITFDSGESSFKMIIEAMPGMETNTSGSSHYFGDIYIDLKTHWVQKVSMVEFVTTEVKIPSFPYKINNAIERLLTLQAITEEEFARQ